MIRLRHQQPSLWETFFAEEVAELWEPWMRAVDEVLEDDELLDAVYDAQGQRHAQSRSRGRHQTPAEVVLRMLILKHVRNWSYETLEREVRANVVYRSFCRIGMEKVPDASLAVRMKMSKRPSLKSWMLSIKAETNRQLNNSRASSRRRPSPRRRRVYYLPFGVGRLPHCQPSRNWQASRRKYIHYFSSASALFP
jgi:hypothetical protein